jgi:tRNA A-37 threonylcarbamoyl transferase component Bud32
MYPQPPTPFAQPPLPAGTPQQPPPLPPGALLASRYRIESYIGGGGFAHIYRARDQHMGYTRAIKEAFYRDPATQRQFRVEAEILLNTTHPNLVKAYTYFEQGARLYLVMDYVEGQTLEDIAIEYIRHTGRALQEAQVLDWMIPICEAAQALHSQPVPIIHRDVKPANIKLSRQGNIPILMDLGLAKLYFRGSHTVGAALAFTPGYAPPEQYQAQGMTDQRTDVYGLGATLYFLLTGYQPVEAPARVSNRALPTPRSLNLHLSEEAEGAVLRAMSLDPAYRQPSAHILGMELRAARARLGDALAQSGVARASGGPPPLRACARCSHMNPPIAQFCMRCGAALTLEPTPGAIQDDAQASTNIAAIQRPTPRLAPVVADITSPTFQQSAHPQESKRPYLSEHPAPKAEAVAASYAEAAGWSTSSTLEQSEAQGSITAVLALLCVMVSLLGAFAPFVLALCLVGLALAHGVLGFQPVLRLAGRRGGAWLESRRWLRWIPWRGNSSPRDFRLIALVALALGYLWLAAIAVQGFLIFHSGR